MPLCGAKAEFTVHALRDCGNVRKVWLASGLFSGDRVWEVRDGWEWLQAVWDFGGEVISVVATVAWLLWYQSC